MAEQNNRLNVEFDTMAFPNENKSAKEGRVVFDNMIVCRIRTPGGGVSVFPAQSTMVEHLDDGTTRSVTYAKRFPAQFAQFERGERQIASGTPIDELPFLTVARRAEMKAVNIYTAEQLASLEGEQLKKLGQGGRADKNKAQAFLESASGSAKVVAMAAEMEAMKAELELLRKNQAAPAIIDPQPVIASPKRVAAPAPARDDETKTLDEMDTGELKDFIREKGGTVPSGNAKRGTVLAVALALQNADDGDEAVDDGENEAERQPPRSADDE